MGNFDEHLRILTSSSTTDSNFSSIEKWSKLQNPGSSSHTGSVYDEEFGDVDVESPWPSVKTVYMLEPTGSDVEDSALGNILVKIRGKDILDSVLSLLSSADDNESIAETLVDLIGFDDVHLIPEILDNRLELIEKIKTILNQPVTDRNYASTEKWDKHLNYEGSDQHTAIAKSIGSAKQRMEDTLRSNASRPLFSKLAGPPVEILPHVYSSSVNQGNILSHLGSKYLLPVDTTRSEDEVCIEVVVPPAKIVPSRKSERLIPISELDELAKGSFPGYISLNRMQSIVFPTAYGTNENLLVAAPTGAGKTDVAILAILRVIKQYRSQSTDNSSIASTIRRSDFKIIYVAPMKALAAEIVQKFSKRLKWLSIEVRELTGDMQLTKAEIARTQVIVTTPEKWDVVTRKPVGEGELASQVKLLIIDEVHLLNEERGSVIETIVARTLRQVESTQSLIRIVGLSATLPNYVDVADFLRVSRTNGLFFFDSSFRPVPLEQHFLGIKGKTGSPQSRKNLDEVIYKKVSSLVNEGHQVMVFVHARKETVKAALALKDAAFSDGTIDDFNCSEHPNWYNLRREVGNSRNKELKQLFDHGFGIHHAGMLRSDRNLIERLFKEKVIKVLCCTATLAWGVNLPAHAVLIKGTQVYDSSRGKFVDLSVLDVLQIFGRAGRPGLETSGEGYICTTEDKLTHYLDAITSQNPIESKFVDGMIDSLNAEVALGTVSSLTEGIEWIGYTYLFVRMRRNPFLYGMLHDETQDDPLLGNKRYELMVGKARQLSNAQMIVFDERTGSLSSTDLGRIAAKYYVRTTSIETYNRVFRHAMSEADILAMLSMSAEFQQIQLRENEVEELKGFMEDEDIVPCQVQGGTDTNEGKVNILFQTYISRVYPEDFALVSDMAYVAQNGSRIIRALLEIAASKRWADVSAVLMTLCKAVEKRTWPFVHPLMQFENELRQDVLYNLKQWADEYTVPELAEKSALELGQLIHLNERHGAALLRVAKEFPSVSMWYKLEPLTDKFLRILITVKRTFEWGSRAENSIEPFWLWIEDDKGLNILQLHHLLFHKQDLILEVEFTVPIIFENRPSFLVARFVSDRWIGADDDITIPLDDLIMPNIAISRIALLKLPFLSTSALNSRVLETHMGNISDFNALQTQSFWSLMNTCQNVLLCSPAGSGKSIMGQMVALKTIKDSTRNHWVLILGRKINLSSQLCRTLKNAASSVNFTFDYLSSANLSFASGERKIVCANASILLAAMFERKWANYLPNLQLVLCDELEQMTSEYEFGLSLLLHATHTLPVRFVGMSAALADAGDLTSWLRVPPISLYSFKVKDRDQDVHVDIQPFSVPYSAALFKILAKHTHSVIRTHSNLESCIVFVHSRHHCKSAAADLLTQCAIDSQLRGYMPDELQSDILKPYLYGLHDPSLKDFLLQGIGFLYEGMDKSDRRLVSKLFTENLTRVLLVPRESCWSLPYRVGLVIVMGTQYIENTGRDTQRRIRDYNLDELNRMQSCATRHLHSGQFHVFCPAEKRESLLYFLNEGLPLESTLHVSKLMPQWFEGQIDKQDCVDILSWTFLARRVMSNPMYYGVPSGTLDEALSNIVDRLLSTDQQCVSNG